MRAEEVGAEGDERNSVEVRARTVDEAVARGLVRLGGLSRSEVEIEVLSEGKTGVLGFGTEEAVVRITVVGKLPAAPGEKGAPARTRERRDSATVPDKRTEAPEPGADGEGEAAAVADTEAAPAAARAAGGSAADVEAATKSALGISKRYLELLGYDDIDIEVGGTLLPVDIEDEESVVLNVRGKGVRKLLSQDGRPLLSLQFLVRLAVNRATGTWTNLLLDVDGDRARRVTELFHLAEQSAELVDREGRPVALPPMTPYERRVVHLALRDHPSVTTQSIGRGDTRKVTVRLKGQLLTGV